MGIGRTTSNKQTSEPRKRLSKLRSLKVPSLDRSRLSLKLKKKLILDEDSSQTSNQAQDHTGNLRASPNYMKATSCSYAKRGSLQPNPGDGSTEIGSAKPVKRIYSLKRSRKMPTTISRSRLSEANIQLSRSGSIKLNRIKSVKLSRKQWSNSRFNRASIFMTDDDQAPGEVSSEAIMRDSQADDMEVASPQSARKRWSESRFDHSSIFMTDQADGMEGTSSYTATRKKPIIGSEDAPSQKPTRTLWKMPSRKYKRILVKKQSNCHEVGNTQFEGLDSTAQVCTYRYCSIHGNVIASSPPVRSFMSYKRRSLKKQKSGSRKRKSKAEATSSSHKTKKVERDDSMSTDIPLDQQKYTNMWGLIYTHFLEHGKGGNEENPYGRNEVVESEKPELNQAEAIEFVQQAVDGILLLNEQPLFEANESANNPDKESLMRQVIATPKLFKEMEKLRPRDLSSEVHSGEETALLRHLSMKKRKDSEEWRLDNALQQVISKLDAAQQKRVSLLVDAFERVTQDPATINRNPKMIMVKEERSITSSDDANSSSSAIDNSRELTVDNPHTGVLVQVEPTKGAEESVTSIGGRKVDSNAGKDTDFNFDKGKFMNVYQRFAAGDATNRIKGSNPHPRQHNVKHDSVRGKKHERKQEAMDQLLGLDEQLSDQQSKTYNKLWKMVGSNKFIKAMDKRKMRGGSKESVILRHLSMDQRKTREEWLHDYALQEVITKLAPDSAQPKRVTMLARAFESLSSKTTHGSMKCIRENEQHKSDVVADDQVLSMIEDDLYDDDNSESFDTEFDMDLYDDNSELSGVNLHIHDQGGPKGCPVCYPHI